MELSHLLIAAIIVYSTLKSSHASVHGKHIEAPHYRPRLCRYLIINLTFAIIIGSVLATQVYVVLYYHSCNSFQRHIHKLQYITSVHLHFN